MNCMQKTLLKKISLKSNKLKNLKEDFKTSFLFSKEYYFEKKQINIIKKNIKRLAILYKLNNK